MDWKGFDIEHWWKAVAAAGVAICVAAIAASNVPGLLIGLGILAIGIGEWINHPYREFHEFPWVATGYPRNPKTSGEILDVIGCILIAIGVGKLIFS